MKKIIRVFPRRTSYTPEDEYVFIGYPPFIIPEHDEVHVSCTFTWDKVECEDLARQWEVRTNKPVKLGGVAFGSPAERTKTKSLTCCGTKGRSVLRAVWKLI